ncbi:protein phosphatase methylesterase 1-like, partial [Saccoglossus kowalevskii]|uniref:protein phosphatase methylesterase-1 n=1 Tax=Saccoglossus kowalevskii TaxID=10224 RepID=A0ABM0M600_SACKO
MGGAIAVHTGAQNILPTLIGIVVIDVVEGTALDSLRSMQSFLSSRPAQFKSLENAIEWSVKTGQIRNIESAKVSMSGQLRRVKEKEQDSVDAVTEGTSRVTGTITEEEEEDGENATKSSQCTTVKKGNKDHYTWRIDLSRTEKHWQGWFKGLSCLFLSCDVPKILVLAGVNRLDRELTIGQMQGKFQMQVLPQCGHSVHEDAPEKVAEVLASFMVRHKFAEPTADFKRPMPAC